MNLRWVAILAWLLAMPGLVLAQTPAGHQPNRPSAVAGTKASPAASGPMLIDVNSADEKTLDTLPGVGPVRAKAIVANRPYSDKNELVARKAVPANVFAQIEDKVALANVNTATAAWMAKILPNVGPIRAQQIVDKRPYSSPQDMVAKGALTQGVFEGIRNLVTTGP